MLVISLLPLPLSLKTKLPLIRQLFPPKAVAFVPLFQSVSRGEFSVNGFRNRDLQGLLFDSSAKTPKEKQRRSAAVSRRLRILRAHGLILKIPHTHRYQLSARGRQILPLILTADQLTLDQFQRAA